MQKFDLSKNEQPKLQQLHQVFLFVRFLPLQHILEGSSSAVVLSGNIVSSVVNLKTIGLEE